MNENPLFDEPSTMSKHDKTLIKDVSRRFPRTREKERVFALGAIHQLAYNRALKKRNVTQRRERLKHYV